VRVTLESLTTLANVATLGVLFCGALAAAVQLRHLRAGNELAALLELTRSFAEPALQHAFLYVQNELAQQLTRPEYRAELSARGFVDPQRHPEMLVCNWFNELGTMAVGGFVDADLCFDSFGRLAEYYWRLLVPVIALLRRERENFERLAGLAEEWRLRHPNGIYAFDRLPLADPWSA
jgi:hypothetical protein